VDAGWLIYPTGVFPQEEESDRPPHPLDDGMVVHE
jgi:hypothetical protein